jgi:hypothetical protein
MADIKSLFFEVLLPILTGLKRFDSMQKISFLNLKKLSVL